MSNCCSVWLSLLIRMSRASFWNDSILRFWLPSLSTACGICTQPKLYVLFPLSALPRSTYRRCDRVPTKGLEPWSEPDPLPISW